MENYGPISQRLKPRIEVPRGYKPESYDSQMARYPVAEGELIQSGMHITPKWNATNDRYEWVIGVNGSSLDHYVALEDYNDPDVLQAGVLPALSCAGQYEIQTPYFKSDDTYLVGDKVTYDAATGNFKKYVAGVDSTDVLGTVTRKIESVLGKNSHVKPFTIVGGSRVANPGLNVLTFRTHVTPSIAV